MAKIRQSGTSRERMEKMGENKTCKSLIKENDETLKYAWEMRCHGNELPAVLNKSIFFASVPELEVQVSDFMSYCYERQIVPSNSALALWLGVSRDTIDDWKNNPAHMFSNTIKSVTEIFHRIVEQKALDGQLNPLLYFFMGKNYFGLSDKTEIVHKSQTTQVIDISEQQRILGNTPGLIIDVEPKEVLSISTSPEQVLNKSAVDLEQVLRGSEQVERTSPEQVLSEQVLNKFEDL